MVEIILKDDETLYIPFEGVLDMAFCEEVTPDIQQHLGTHEGPVHFDLAKVKMVTSAFFGLCISTHNKLGEGRLVILNVTPQVKRTFVIAQLNKILDIQ